MIFTKRDCQSQSFFFIFSDFLHFFFYPLYNRHKKRRQLNADVNHVFQYANNLIDYNPHRHQCCYYKWYLDSQSHCFSRISDKHVHHSTYNHQKPHAYFFDDSAHAFITIYLLLPVLRRNQPCSVINHIASNPE